MTSASTRETISTEVHLALLEAGRHDTGEDPLEGDRLSVAGIEGEPDLPQGLVHLIVDGADGRRQQVVSKSSARPHGPLLDTRDTPA